MFAGSSIRQACVVRAAVSMLASLNFTMTHVCVVEERPTPGSEACEVVQGCESSI